mmetsp:Transcript_29730/g.59154  ORF Transcript_29730/g.59154 Transcript_29730/m.59154 type:complete len:219 (+) Transcript_29730:93-749(+)
MLFSSAKKTGRSLALSAPYAAEVYTNLYPSSPRPPGHNRSKAYCKILHVTAHTIPTPLGVFALIVLSSLWILLYPPRQKVIGLFASAAYTLVEYAFTKLERGVGYTSLAQLFANLLYVPALLEGYKAALELVAAGDPGFFVYVLLYPINVWFLEAFEESFLIRPIYGRNVAWNYSDYADEAMGGCVRLGHAPAWWALGAAVRLGAPLVEGAVDALLNK